MPAGLRRKWGLASSAGRKASLLLTAAACLLAGLAFGAMRGHAADGSAHDFFYASFYVFAPSSRTPSVSVINKATDQMIGRIALPVVASQIVVSETAHLLAAIDGRSRCVVLVDLASDEAEEVGLAIVPQKLWIGSGGSVLAAVDPAHGAIAFVALAERRGQSHVQSYVNVAGPIHDVLFSPDDARLFVAADTLTGIGVIDVGRGEMIATIPFAGSNKARFTGLTRSADGLTLYAADADGPAIRFAQPQSWPPGAIDGSTGGAAVWPANYDKYVVDPIGVTSDTAEIFPTGYGKYLVALDNGKDKVTLVATDSWKPVAQLRGLAEMNTVYSGWFDEVAIIASTAEPKLLAVDLDRLTRAGEIALPGVPGQGAVTDDGSKLYVPIADADVIAVIDLRNRRLLAKIPVDAAPSAAVMTRSFDVCH